MYWSHHYWGMHMFWWIFWLVIVITLLMWPTPRRWRPADTALGTLRRRYAAGEIGDEEYLHKLAILESSKAGAAPSRSEPIEPGPPQPTSGSAA